MDTERICLDKKNIKDGRNIFMDYNNYQRILRNVIKCAPLECGVQTLVFMLLDEVIYDRYGEDLRVLVADLRDNNSVFGGIGGVLDICIVNKYFEYVDKKGTELSDHKRNRCGCVEIKMINEDLDKHIEQVAGHIVEYGKVLYTDGLIWKYYCPTQEQIKQINKILSSDKTKKSEEARETLEKCKVVLRELYSEKLKQVNLTKNYIENFKNEVEKEHIEICEKALEAFQKRSENQINVNGLKKILQEIIDKQNGWEIIISEEKESEIVIIQSQYNLLKNELRKIEW